MNMMVKSILTHFLTNTNVQKTIWYTCVIVSNTKPGFNIWRVCKKFWRRDESVQLNASNGNCRVEGKID